MSGIQVFYSSVSGNKEIKRKQKYIIDLFDAKKIEYLKVDIACEGEDKDTMKRLADGRECPPLVVKGEKVIGGFEEIEQAVEGETLQELLLS